MSVRSSAILGSLTMCCAGSKRHGDAIQRVTDEVKISPVKRNRQFRQVRRRFLVALWRELRVVWPIVSGLVALQLVLGASVSLLQGWPLGDAFYFTFVTALSIGYGDLVPKGFFARLIAIVIGFTGILLTGLVAAIGVHALQQATDESVGSPEGEHPARPRPSRDAP
jgi:hypothetical protein